MTYAITLIEPRRLLDRPNLTLAKPMGIGQSKLNVRNIKFKNLDDLRPEIMKAPSLNVFQEKTLEKQHIQRNRRSVKLLKPTNSRKSLLLSCKLQSYNLAITSNGTVRGEKNTSSPNGR